jgi:ABC-2 type transport system permease protein
MRLRLLLHGMRRGNRVAGFGIGLVVGLVVSVGSAMLVAAQPGFSLAALLFTIWTLGWIFGPILMAGSDANLQPEHFSLLPLRPSRLAVGLAIATAVGVAPIVTLIAFAGLLVPASEGGPAAIVVAVVGMVLQLGFAILASRVVVGWLGSVLRSRRGRDVGVLLASGVALLMVPAEMMTHQIVPILLGASHSGLGAVVLWFPSGWAPAAVRAVVHGQWLPALGALLGLTVLDGLLMLAWSVLLRRRLTVASADSYGAATRVRGGRWDRLVPATPVGAVLIKELRCWWRDTRRRAALVPSLLVGLALPFFFQLGNQDGPRLIPYAALFVVWVSTLNSGNLYGYDAAPLRQLLVTGVAPIVDIRGRQLAWLVLVAPLVALAALVLPLAAGSPAAYPWVLALAPAGLGAGSGVLLVLSVFAPYPAPEQRGNPFASRGQPGFSKGIRQLGGTALLAASMVPTLAVLLIGFVLGSAALRWTAVPVGIATGVVCAWWFGRIAARGLRGQGPRILQTVHS